MRVLQKILFFAKALLSQPVINFSYHLPLAYLANLVYGFPARKLTVIGVTGTDGKTTTCNLIYHLLTASGRKAAVISTVEAIIGDIKIDTGFHVTSPDPFLLQKILSYAVKQNITYVVLETTSFGLDQFRIFGVPFRIAVLTNITHEHLDYHRTFEKYRLAKMKLLDQAKIVIYNRDDDSYDFVEKRYRNSSKQLVCYGLTTNTDYNPQKFPIKPNQPGTYNLQNSLAAIAVVDKLGVDIEEALVHLQSFPGVIGRMQEIKLGQPYRVIVDFAHTPNGLQQVLTAVRQNYLTASSQLIIVFGSAGLRDQQKRPMMGDVAGRLADKIIITAEDPRTENVTTICRQIAQGCLTTGKQPQIIEDRRLAIETALNQASKNDIVLICGKGHEKTMCFGDTEIPWSDQQTVTDILREKYTK